MTNSKNTKRALLASLLSTVVCCAMLIGSTFAWFTDSVTSTGNIIKSGNLDVTLELANGTEALDMATWKDASTGPIFNYSLWEPGYTEVRHVRISNKGNLALKYEIRIVANGEVSKLADVIDVYYIKDGKQITSRTGLTDENKIGTLAEVLAKPYAAKGHILAGDNAADVATITLKMQETAGNEYKDLSIGTDFSIQLVATQYTEEEDGFGSDYDKDAFYADVTVKDETELKDAIKSAEDGDVIAVAGDMQLTESLSIHKDITIDGMGTGVISEKPVYIGENNTVTIRNMTFTAPENPNNNASSLYANSFKGKLVLENVKFVDFQWEGIQITPLAGAEIVVDHCYFSNSQTMAESGIETKRYFHVEVTDGSTNINDIKVTLTNNTFNNVVQSKKGGNGYFSDSAVTICGVPKENLICAGNIFTGKVAENALTDYNILWIQNGRSTAIKDLIFDGFEIGTVD